MHFWSHNFYSGFSLVPLLFLLHFWSHIFYSSCRFGPVLHFWSHIFGSCYIIGPIFFSQVAESVPYLWVRCKIGLIYLDQVRLAVKLFAKIWDQFCNMTKRYGTKSDTGPNLQLFAKIWDQKCNKKSYGTKLKPE